MPLNDNDEVLISGYGRLRAHQAEAKVVSILEDALLLASRGQYRSARVLLHTSGVLRAILDTLAEREEQMEQEGQGV